MELIPPLQASFIQISTVKVVQHLNPNSILRRHLQFILGLALIWTLIQMLKLGYFTLITVIGASLIKANILQIKHLIYVRKPFLVRSCCLL